jgi:hypothetical protein
VYGHTGAHDAFERTGQYYTTFLLRHMHGDRGDLDPEDQRRNDQAVRNGTRLLSAYHPTEGTHIWMITEADRSATTILLPEEY